MDRVGGGGSDPYEERLLAVFESCDSEGRGLLDGEGLSRLCQMLHLEDRRSELMSRLLPAPPATSSLVPHPLVDITFPKFREALLALLASPGPREPSPVREVSPKFVYGQKKYGRRSRPESTDHDNNCNEMAIEESEVDGDTFIVEIKDNPRNGDVTPDREILAPERLETGEINSVQFDGNLNIGNGRTLDKETEVESGTGEAELRSAWARLGVGSDGYLHRNELAMVCSAVGMDTLADQVVAQVFSKLNTDQDGRISFEEFLELFRSRAGSPPSLPRTPPLPFPQPPSPDGFAKSPSVSSDLWENGGVGSVGGMNVTRLLQELQSVRTLLESVTEERDKLRSDLADANYRAAVLAQEVDEHHARIETATHNKVKLLEQKHAEEVKEIKRQAACDREQLANANQKLELEVTDYVDQLSRVTSQLATLQKEYETLEKENRVLGERLQESKVSSDALHKQLECMNAMHQRVLELESAEECSLGLKERLGALQAENTELRDRNDELTTQLELLQTTNTRQPQRRENSWEGSCGGGTKRRGAKSPTVGDWSSDVASRRMGKVRRCCTEDDLSSAAPPTAAPLISPGCLSRQQNSESGLESDFDTLAGSSPTPSNCSIENGSCAGSSEQEIERLRAYVHQLESKLDQYQMMKEWDLSKANVSTSDDDSSLQYATSGTVKSESTQTTIASIRNESDVMAYKSLEDERGNGEGEYTGTLEVNNVSARSAVVEEQSKNKKNAFRINKNFVSLDYLQNRILKILSKSEDVCNRRGCCTFRRSIEDLMHELQSGDSADFEICRKLNGDLEIADSVKDKKSGSSPFRLGEANGLDSIECYELLAESAHSDTANKITKFDKLSQFAFEFIDDSLKESVIVATNPAATQHTTDGQNGHRGEENKAGGYALKINGVETVADKGILVERLTEENAELSQRCADLETSLEMMRVEYEKTEDYWANKLDEERRHFELDQQQSDEKFAELEVKIQEYAEMLSNEQGRKQFLPPIEERDFLEKQFTDLEEEYDAYRQAVELELARKDCDIGNLEQALAATRTHHTNTFTDSKNAEVQTDILDVDVSSAPSVDQAEESDKKCSGGCWCASSMQESERREVRKARELRARLKLECDALVHHKNNLIFQLGAIRASTQISCREMMEGLNLKLREQEARCRHLQSALRHHQRHTQRLMNKEWERYKSDLTAMKGVLKLTNEKLKKQSATTKQLWEKLSAADVFVKNLFVKNSELELALVRLQQHHNNNNNKVNVNALCAQDRCDRSSMYTLSPTQNKHQYNSL